MCTVEECEGVSGSGTALPNDNLVSYLTRSFYKAVIMSEDFCEMTSQSLRSTRTHVCVLTSTELSSTETDEAENSVVLLDDADVFNDYFLLKGIKESEIEECSVLVTSADSSSSSSKSSTNSPPLLRVTTDGRRGKKKVLLIKLILQERKDKFDSSIDSIREKFLFCYQIPLRLKGIVSCKNTQM